MPDWSQYDIPRHIQDLQKAWERRHRVRIARLCSGVSLRELGAALGIGPERVRGLQGKAQREIDFGIRSPVEVFLARPDSQTRRLMKQPKAKAAIERLASKRDWLTI